MLIKATKKALKEGDIVEHKIRSYTKLTEPNIQLPTAYCNELMDDGTVDRRPILPQNYEDIILYKNGEPYHYGKRVKMKIIDTSNDSYYIAWYYLKDEDTSTINEQSETPKKVQNVKYELKGTIQSGQINFDLTGTYDGFQKYHFRTAVSLPNSEIIFDNIYDNIRMLLLNQK